jgi:hypothetical protein
MLLGGAGGGLVGIGALAELDTRGGTLFAVEAEAEFCLKILVF